MSSIEDLGLTTYKISVAHIPAIVLKMLGVTPPAYLPSISEISIPDVIIDQVIMVIIDNFSLYEVITYQPPFIIKNLENVLMIETDSKQSALSSPMLQNTFFTKSSKTFDLVKRLTDEGLSVKVLARSDDLPKITNDLESCIAEETDINIYVKGLKAINRNDLVVMHYADFDEMYERYSMNPPEEIASKVMRRTDKWLSLFWQQSIEGTALLVIGNDGKRPLDLTLEGRAAEWKRANVPIGIVIYPKD
ncbi:MAG: hypothetical protein U9O98_03000 [Asgard group archaeon]|nr:hypothetical protein [Asgard group archaeon]